MSQYTFTVKMSLESEMRPDILEFLIANTLRDLNVNVMAGKEEKPVTVEVKGKKN